MTRKSFCPKQMRQNANGSCLLTLFKDDLQRASGGEESGRMFQGAPRAEAWALRSQITYVPASAAARILSVCSGFIAQTRGLSQGAGPLLPPGAGL